MRNLHPENCPHCGITWVGGGRTQGSHYARTWFSSWPSRRVGTTAVAMRVERRLRSASGNTATSRSFSLKSC